MRSEAPASAPHMLGLTIHSVATTRANHSLEKASDAIFGVSTALATDAVVYPMNLGNSAARIPDMVQAMLPLFAAGTVKAVVHKTYLLSEARQALAVLVAGKVIGKLILTP